MQRHGRIIDNFIAAPSKHDVHIWNFIIFGIDDPAYKDGYYLGQIKFDSSYPDRPPAEIKLLVGSGRFKTNEFIDLKGGVIQRHGEGWRPNYNISTVLMSLISVID